MAQRSGNTSVNGDARFFRLLHFVGKQATDAQHRQTEYGLAQTQAQPAPVSLHRNGAVRSDEQEDIEHFLTEAMVGF